MRDHRPAGMPGALVLSLDFELMWGLRERATDGEDARRLTGAREVVLRTLELFEQFEVAATWATVGFLFAESKAELERYTPQVLPEYQDPRLSPYADSLGEGEEDDPFHYAPSLIRAIQSTPRQEVATHTFSHYYCREAGQTRDSFRADLAAASALAAARGVRLRSIVFPRNQHNPAYDDILLEHGIRAYRGNPHTGSWEFTDAENSRRRTKRLGRLAEAYLGRARSGPTPWEDISQPNGLSDVRASGMLRPYQPALGYLERARLERIRRSLRWAARECCILHLWWHPHNFGLHPQESLALLRHVLIEFTRCRERDGLVSLSMAEVDDALSKRPGAGEAQTTPAPAGSRAGRAATQGAR